MTLALSYLRCHHVASKCKTLYTSLVVTALSASKWCCWFVCTAHRVAFQVTVSNIRAGTQARAWNQGAALIGLSTHPRHLVPALWWARYVMKNLEEATTLKIPFENSSWIRPKGIHLSLLLLVVTLVSDVQNDCERRSTVLFGTLLPVLKITLNNIQQQEI